MREFPKPKALPYPEGLTKGAIHACIDRQLDPVEGLLQQHLQAGQLTEFVRIWSHAVEEGLLDACQVGLQERKQYRGRGKAKVRITKPDWAVKVESIPNKEANSPEVPLHGAMLMYCRCLNHLSSLANCRRPARGQEWPRELHQVFDSLQSRARHLKLGEGAVPALAPDLDPWTKIIPACKLAAMRVRELARTQEAEHRKAKSQALNARLSDAKMGSRECFRIIREPPAARMAFIDTEGGLTSDPGRIDEAARAKWGRIYEGNVASSERWAHADRVIETYSPYLYSRAEFQVPRISTHDVFHAFTKCGATAPGPDAWAIRDLRNISWRAADWLRQMYQAIEDGADWPDQTVQAKSAFLAKSPGASTSILDYRILSICSVLYRRWSAIRLFHMRPWASEWWLPEMFGGRGCPGADTAAWGLAIEVEQATAQGQGISALALDIYKCVDQMSREVVMRVAERAGAPRVVTATWYKFMAALRTHNCLVSNVGLPYGRSASIPQGCPQSMQWLCLTLRPLLLLAKSCNTIPRTLADDATIYARGVRHWARVRAAGQAAFLFLESIGSKASPGKCNLFSNSVMTRKAMRKFVWPALGVATPVCCTARDLGAQANFGRVATAGVLIGRMRKAAPIVRHIGNLPIAAAMKVRLVKGKALAMGLYGCESTPTPHRPCQAFATAIKVAVTPGAPGMAAPLASRAIWGLKSPDPVRAILIKRVKKARQMWHLSLSMQQMIMALLQHYCDMGQGPFLASGDLPGLEIQGMVVRELTQSPRTPESRAAGPVALMLASLRGAGIALDSAWRAHFPQRAVFSLCWAPWPQVLKFLPDCYIEHGLRAQARPRASLRGEPQIDWPTTLSLAMKFSGDRASMLKAIQAGAILTPHELVKAGIVDSGRCSECGHERWDLAHMLWSCPAFQGHRTKVEQLLGQHTWEELPTYLALHTLAPRASVCYEGPAWGLPRGHVEPSLTGLTLLSGQSQVWNDRFTCELLSGPFPCERVADMPRVFGYPPEQPQVYTDGSVWQQRSGCGRLGGGVFIDTPMLERHPVEGTPFHDYTLPAARRGAFKAPMTGPGTSSSRAEILAYAVALTYPHPINIATDSMAVIYGSRRVRRLLMAKAFPEPLHIQQCWGPLANSSDGDAWAQVATIIQARGPNTSIATKVKAHIDASTIGTRISARDWAGNAAADEVAGQASIDPRPWRAHVGQHMRDRKQQVASLVEAIQVMAVDVLMDASKRFNLHRKVEAPLRCKMIHVAWPGMPGGDTVQPRRVVRLVGRLARARGPDWRSALHGFLFGREWSLVEMPAPICPWLVLLVAFELATGVKVPAVTARPVSQLAPRETANDVLSEFRAAVAAVARDGMHPDEKGWFASVTQSKHVLAGLGFQGPCQGCRAWPKGPDIPWQAVVKATLGMHKKLPRDWLTLMDQGTLVLPRTPLSLAVPPAWRVPIGAPGSQGPVHVQGPSQAPYSLRCPHCPSVIVLNSRPQRQGTRYPKVRCPSCRKEARCGQSLCVRCDCPVAGCQCDVLTGVPGRRQVGLHRFF